MLHEGTVTITTPRLRLRRFTVKDAPDMYENWAKDKEVTRFLSWEPHASVQATAELLEDWVGAYGSENYLNWAIEYGGAVIGSVSVVKWSEKHQWAELGYCIGARFWGKGIMTEAAGAVTDYLFSRVGFNKVVISNARENPASGRVAEKCGFTLDGVLREDFLLKEGRFADMEVRSQLRREWKARINGK